MSEDETTVVGKGGVRSSWPLAIAVVVGVVALLGVASLAVGGEKLGGAIHGWHRVGHGGGGHGWGRGHARDPEAVQEHAARAAGFALAYVDATEEQEVQIQTLLAESIDGFFGLREGHEEAHDALVAALSGAQVDRAALEALRVEHLALADAASRQLAETLADIADVLTPDQRADLADFAARAHRFHR